MYDDVTVVCGMYTLEQSIICIYSVFHSFLFEVFKFTKYNYQPKLIEFVIVPTTFKISCDLVLQGSEFHVAWHTTESYECTHNNVYVTYNLSYRFLFDNNRFEFTICSVI